MKCPCKGCHDRTITCHGVCVEYQEWKKEYDNKMKWLRDQLPPVNEQGRKGRFRKIMEKARGWG